MLCIKIGVDCVLNDPVDVNCGGPEYLGFDFYVPAEEVEEMKKYIIEVLDSFEIPLVQIYKYGIIDLDKDKVWTRVKILESIKEDASYLKSEAGMNYTRRR